MRLFVALAVPDTVRAAIESLIGELKLLDDSWKWARAENVHVTLKFLGEVAPENVPKIILTLRSVPAAGPIALKFQGLGFFPNEQRPRVLWVGMDGRQRVLDLAAGVAVALAGVGFPHESREFAPHLTLARSKLGTISQTLRDAVRKYTARQFGTMNALTFHLIESGLKSTGPEYTTIESFPLTR